MDGEVGEIAGPKMLLCFVTLPSDTVGVFGNQNVQMFFRGWEPGA